uniref:Ubiquitin-like protease family profile domain-containing protein n=1 Tax=Oryza meridionalis TaxID=40149 RepID=A0A0E0DCW9_9ORYZ
MVCETVHTVRISEDSAVLKNKTPQEKKDYIKRLHKRKMPEVGNYLATSFLAHSDKRVIMIPYHFGEHYILFLIYPMDQTVVVLDPADYDKDAYMEFLSHGRYKKRGGYVKNPSRDKLYIRGRWPCYKQPSLMNLCGYYVCEMLRKTLITLCVDLFRFIRHDICNHLREFHDRHSELATDPKFKNLRKVEREHAVD